MKCAPGGRMNEFGTRNPANGIDSIGFTETGAVHYNLTEAALCEQAIGRREATFSADGALVAYTGQHTGRSPKDKFVVCDASTEDQVWWDNNKPMTPTHFETLLADF